MTVRSVAGAIALALPLLTTFASEGISADTAAAMACAATLPKDAKVIFDATLPQIGPGADLRSLVTSNTRSLALSGSIDRGSARQSATEAGECLKRAGS
jgi:hypothetical protein